MTTVGIDLGTTFSAASYVDGNGHHQLIQLAHSPSMPSVVWISDQEDIEVGQTAMNRWGADKGHVVRWIKKCMGDPSYLHPAETLFTFESGWQEDVELPTIPVTQKTRASVEIPESLAGVFKDNGKELPPTARLFPIAQDRTYSLTTDIEGGYVLQRDTGDSNVWSVRRGYSAIKVSSLILAQIKTLVEQELKGPIDEAVITCPAYFNSDQIEATRTAGQMAGLTVREIAKEPVAAAVYHGIRRGDAKEVFLVADLGGGTFDLTLMEQDGNQFTPLHTAGDRNLGGYDWTTFFADAIAKDFEQEFDEDPSLSEESNQRLIEAAEQAKQTLQQVEQALVMISGETAFGNMTLTREMFNDATRHLDQRVRASVTSVIGKAAIAWELWDGTGDLDEATKRECWQRISCVLLVGGSSRLLRVKQLLEDDSGRPVELGSEPDLMVTYGAAYIGADGEVFRPGGTGPATEGGILTEPPTKVVVGAKLVRSFGIRSIAKGSSDEIINSCLLRADTEIPANESKTYVVRGQDYVDIPVVEYENESDYEGIHGYRCNTSALRPGEEICLTFHYDRDGVLSAEAETVAGKQPLTLERTQFRDPQKTEATSSSSKPYQIVFALDTSYSMEDEDADEDDLDRAKEELLKFATMILEKNAAGQIGVVTFSSSAELICEPTRDSAKIKGLVDPIRASGSTNMADGLRLAKTTLLKSDSTEQAQRTVVMLTDGMPDSQDATRAAAREVQDAGIQLAMVNIGTMDEVFMSELTKHCFTVDSIPDGLADQIFNLLQET